MNNFLQDLKQGFRMLVKNPALSLGAILVLGFGISGNTVIFSMANAYLLRQPNFSQPERLVHVWETNKRQGFSQIRASLPNYLDWRAHNQVFSDMAVFNYTGENVVGAEGPERVQSGRVSANVFEVLGVKPHLGRAFESGEDQPGRGDKVILSFRYWQQRYGGKADAIGQTLRLNDRVHTIIGVMPENFAFPLTTTQIWVPRELDVVKAPRDQRFLQVAARLKPGVTVAQAQAEMNTIASRLAKEYPQSNGDSGVSLTSLHQSLNFAYDVLSIVLGVLGVAGLFLLAISCALVANLTMSRAIGRMREMAIRAALGASRSRVIRQLLTENLVLAFGGGALGILLAYWTLNGMAGAIPEDLYKVGQLQMDGAALAFTLGLCLLTVLMFGLAPALQVSHPNLTEALKEGTPGAATGRSANHLYRSLTIGQVSLSLVLLSGAALIAQAFMQLQSAQLGYDTRNVLTMVLTPARAKYDTPEKQIALHRDLLREAGAVPGVSVAATVDYLPLNHETNPVEVQTDRDATPAKGQERTASALTVSPDYFRAAGITIRRGRAFTAQDHAAAPRMIIINETLEKKLFPGQDAIGRTLYVKDFGKKEAQPCTIAGVARDIRFGDEFEGVFPMQVYVPVLQDPPSYFRLIARAEGAPTALAPALREAIWRVDGALPILEVRTMDEVVAESLLPRRMMASTLGIFALQALLLAAIGLYGIVANWVARRTREIGIRMALGAQPGEIQRLVLRQGVRLVVIGLVLGFAGSLGVAKLLSSVIAGLSLFDPLALLIGPVLLLCVTLLACYVPARRATRVDPLTALRYE